MAEGIALANNDVILLAWSYDEPISECLGFAIYRCQGEEEPFPLPAWVGFEGESNPDWDASTTERWPVQKYWWRDLTAAQGNTYRYEIVPRVGDPRNLRSVEERRIVTNEVTLTPVCSAHVSAYFNRGILSTQALAHQLPHDEKDGPSSDELLAHIVTPGDPIRMSLAGQIIDGLSLLPRRAKTQGGHVDGALYELNDRELVDLLKDPDHVSLVLANAGDSDDPDATNRDARSELHDAGVDVTDRMHSSGHIGHNKSLIYEDPSGNPQSILTGSTNWTSTGLAAQANNAVVIDDAPLAARYRDYWRALKAECPANPTRHATQSDAMRANDESLSQNSIAHPFTVDDASVSVCFSPNTQLHRKPSARENPNPVCPSDMAELFSLIGAAEAGILFLLFQPGSPSILDAILDAQTARPSLFVRGAATDPKAIENYDTTLYHRTGDHPEIAAAAAVDHPFGYWQRELLKSSPTAHAIIHDKILVLDPMQDNCAVVVGSHNLGYSASYANDENFLIVRGHRRLAQAYATHVMDLYDHYRWRWRHAHPRREGTNGGDRDNGASGLATDDRWQAKYFEDVHAVAERTFWLTSHLPPRT